MAQELLDSETALSPKLITRLVDTIQQISPFKKAACILLILLIETILIYNLSLKSFSWMEIVEVYVGMLFSTIMYGFGIYLLITGISAVLQKIFAVNPKVNELSIISTIFILAVLLFISFGFYAIYVFFL